MQVSASLGLGACLLYTRECLASESQYSDVILVRKLERVSRRMFLKEAIVNIVKSS